MEALLKVVPVRDEIMERLTEASVSETTEAGEVEEVDPTGFEIITK